MNYSINSFRNFKQWKAVINVLVMLCINVVDSDRTKVARWMIVKEARWMIVKVERWMIVKEARWMIVKEERWMIVKEERL
jgi:hypothetical protein